MGKHFFSGKDPIVILNFFARFIRNTNFLGKGEAQLFIAFPYLLSDSSQKPYEAVVKMTTLEKYGLIRLLEAVNILYEVLLNPPRSVTALAIFESFRRDLMRTNNSVSSVSTTDPVVAYACIIPGM